MKTEPEYQTKTRPKRPLERGGSEDQPKLIQYVRPQLSQDWALLRRKALLRSLALQLMTRHPHAGTRLRLSQCSVRTQVPTSRDVAARKDESLRVLSSPSPCACAGPVRQLFERGHLGDGYPQHRSPPLPGPQSFPRYFAQQELFSLPRTGVSYEEGLTTT